MHKHEIFIIPTYSPILGLQADSRIIGTICTENTVILTATLWLQKILGRCGLPELSGFLRTKPYQKVCFLTRNQG